jgi:hypothetical protein
MDFSSHEKVIRVAKALFPWWYVESPTTLRYMKLEKMSQEEMLALRMFAENQAMKAICAMEETGESA